MHQNPFASIHPHHQGQLLSAPRSLITAGASQLMWTPLKGIAWVFLRHMQGFICSRVD